MKRQIKHLLLTCLLISTSFLFATSNIQNTTFSTSESDSAIFDINRICNYFSNNGSIVDFTVTGNSGFEWPKNSGSYSIFASGITIIGKDGNGNFRTSIVEYVSENQPGKILPNGNPDDPSINKYKVYTIHKGNTTGSDYINWPEEDGAPVDDSGNPLCLGDQTHWFVCNDADTTQHLWETDPIGLETQYTIFGVDSTQGLRDVMFVKALLLNKGNVTLDSTYVGIWCDPDLGDASDDYVGCDTSHNIGYCYNGDSIDYDYGDRIPAVGIQLLQGAMIPSPGDT
ncbi:MAG: hypothetical protein KAT54_06300, partial [Candidatus Marinimicrobia bacterium]|nr:hypothetical protein [Candidatus Neomarinimicrobiota bacterium]